MYAIYRYLKLYNNMNPTLFIFIFHDDICNLFSLGPDSAAVRANRMMNIGEEITTYYGSSYFGLDNFECMCHSCEKKQVGHFKPQIILSVVNRGYYLRQCNNPVLLPTPGLTLRIT